MAYTAGQSGALTSMNNPTVLGQNTADTVGQSIEFLKAHGPFLQAGSATGANDVLGAFNFNGDDESASIPSAKIIATCVDATVASSGTVTSKLAFYTMGGAGSLERLTIAKTGEITIAAPDSGTGLTISGGGVAITGGVVFSATTFVVTASAASATAVSFDSTNAAGGFTVACGTGGLNMGNQADCTTIGIGDFAPTAARTITIGGGTVVTAAVTDTLDLAPDGATTNADSVKTVNINTGTVVLGQVLTNIASGTVTSGTHTTSIASGNRAAGTMALNVFTGTGTKTMAVGNADGLSTIGVKGVVSINASQNSNTAINTGTSTGTVGIGNSLAGAITVATAAAVSIDSATASYFKVTGAADLTLQSTAGAVIATSAKASATAIQMTASDAAGGVAISSGTAGIAIAATNGVVAITSGTGAINIGADAAAHIVTVGSTTTTAGTVIQSGSGDVTVTSTDAVTIDAAGVLELNSSAGAISVGNDAVSQAINIGTAGARTITMGNSTGATSLVLDCGTGALNIGTNAIAHTVTIGNGTGITSVVVNSGSGAASFGANATDHTTTIGSTTVASHTIIQGGTSGVSIQSAGIMNIVPVTDSQASPSATSTINANVGVATFTGFTTAAAASQTFTITNSVVSATSAILVTVDNIGANDAQMTITRVKPGAGSFDVVVKNNGAAALNGDLKINFICFAA